MKIKAAVIQTNAGPLIEDNLRKVEEIIRAAVKEGAKLVLTPENTCRMLAKPEDKKEHSYREEDHPALPFFSALAKELDITVVVGSLSSVRADDGRLFNRSYLFGRDGVIQARYDKIHTFDVDLPNGDKYRESDSIKAGDKIVLGEADGLKIGMSVCYDVRFPHIYRRLAKGGAQIITIPAAFTVPTGEAHWEVLLRARAIESGAFVLASAQVGIHDGGKRTYGHSMIISPWGEILQEIQHDSAGYACAELDLEAVGKARSAIPTILHDQSLR